MAAVSTVEGLLYFMSVINIFPVKHLAIYFTFFNLGPWMLIGPYPANVENMVSTD